jgi:S-layer protein
MRAPNEPERKKDKEKNLSPEFSFFLIASLVLSVLFYSMSPVLAVDGEKRLSIVLIDGDEVYVRSGSYYNFSQDYRLYVKSADSDGKRVWLELRRKGISLKDDIATEGSQFVYSRDSTEILNLTVSTIYAGADGGVLVRFSPVYQYLDLKLPMPQTSNGSHPNSSYSEPSEAHGLETQTGGFNVLLFLLGLGAVLLIIGFFAGKGKKL